MAATVKTAAATTVTMAPLKVAVIGVGNLGAIHADIYRRMPCWRSRWRKMSRTAARLSSWRRRAG